MRNLSLTILLGTALLFSNCSTIRKTTASTNQAAMETTDSIIGKKWKLIELRGNPVTETINGKVPFIQLQHLDTHYSASAGCNGLGGTYTLSDNGRIKFTQGMSTMMACENMEAETEFKKILELTDNYTVNGDVLSLNKGRMAPLARFQEVIEEVGQELNSTWELDYISGVRIAFDGLFPNKKPVITFNLPQTEASGNGSCNNFNVAFNIDGNSIKFSEAAATRMACPGNGEATFFSTLKTVTKYSVNSNTLNLIAGDIAVMRFHKNK